MELEQAFRNRGLLVPEQHRPIYRIAFGLHKYHRETVEFAVEDWRTAKQELLRQWIRFARYHVLPLDCITDIHCIKNRY